MSVLIIEGHYTAMPKLNLFIYSLHVAKDDDRKHTVISWSLSAPVTLKCIIAIDLPV